MRYKKELPHHQRSRSSKIDEDKRCDLAKCFQVALYYLNRRDRTQKELTQKLSDRGFDQETALKTIKKLKNLNFVDDERFARNFVKSSFNFKPKGRRRLMFELKRKGLDEELVERVLQDEWTNNEYSLIIGQAKKLVKKNSRLQREKNFQRTLGALLRRGFDYTVCKKAVLECLDELN